MSSPLIPFPERTELDRERRSNFNYYFEDLISQGYSKKKAFRRAQDSISWSDSDCNEMEELLNSPIYKVYWKWSYFKQNTFEIFSGMMPLSIIVIYFLQEVPMMSLIEQGGAAMYPILALGVFAVLFQFKIIFSWFFAKNHSDHSLKRQPRKALQLGFGVLILGFFGTMLGLYKSLHYVANIDDVGQFQKLVAWGVSESIVNIIFASGFFLVIASLHFLIGQLAELNKMPRVN